MKIEDFVQIKRKSSVYCYDVGKIIDYLGKDLLSIKLKNGTIIEEFKWNLSLLEKYQENTYCLICLKEKITNFICNECQSNWCKKCLGLIFTHQNNFTDEGIFMHFDENCK